jgi:hypothetical protein
MVGASFAYCEPEHCCQADMEAGGLIVIVGSNQEHHYVLIHAQICGAPITWL